MTRLLLLCTAVLALAASSVAPVGATTPARHVQALTFHAPSRCGSRGRSRPDIRHVIVILFENHSYSEVIGHARYLTALANACGLATNYHSVGSPSLPNYLAMTSGSTHGLHTDCTPMQCSQSSMNIFTQLGSRGITWRAFDEAMPTNCAFGTTTLYAARHNPAVYYKLARPGCRIHDVRLGIPSTGPFHSALHGRLGAYVFVTPNICNDMHDCPVSVGDAWLSTWIPAIRSSPVYQAGHTAIVITFDEGAGAHVPAVVVSPYTRAGTRSSHGFSHYSLLHMSEYVLGIRTFLGSARTALGFGTAFRLG